MVSIMGSMSKRNLKLARTLSINLVEEQIRRDKKKSQHQENSDTTTRREIQSYIMKYFREGKSKEQILRRLHFEYGRKYPQYAIYFESWVNNVVGKYTTTRAREDEER